jgi:cytochrome c biogenesis protein CcmG, thiol:disulfide interchange protein DsbE
MTARPQVARLGDPAPALRGTTLDGSPFDLASLRGRPVLVNFWGSWCVPCRDEFPLLEAAEKAHAAQGLAIVGVLFNDDPAPARRFVQQFGADWPSISDTTTARDVYGVAFAPQTYFIDRSGVLRNVQYGQLTQALLDEQLAPILG